MSDSIQWWDRSWNPVTGCTYLSDGCDNCYARAMHERFNTAPFSEVTLHPERLNIPLHWRKPRRVFVCSMSDLFHEQVPFGFVMRCLFSMAHAAIHTYFLLTKRPERMLDFWRRWSDLSGEDFQPKLVRGPEATRKAHSSPRGQLFADMLESMGTPPPRCAYPTFDWMEGMISWPSTFSNIWLGVTAENQEMLDKRVPFLLQTPAAHRFLSLEPLLAQVLLPVSVCACGHSRGLHGDRPGDGGCRGARGTSTTLLCECRKLRGELRSAIDQVFVGPETGPMRRRRVCNEEWIRSIVDQCKEAGVACYIKAFPVTTATTSKPRSWISHDPSEWPSWARVRELR